MHCLPPLFVMESHPAMYMRVCEEWVCEWGEEGEGGEEEEQNTSLNTSRDVIGVHIITCILNSHHTC